MPSEKSGKDRITKADRTRARLVEVATRLFQEHGSDEVTVRRIAAAAKIEAGSIYYHFSSRDQILRAVLERGVGDASEEVLAAIADAGADSSPVVRMLAMGALTWVAEWYDPNGAMTPDDVADELMRVLTKGIAKS
jgi:AcrR family transcriptional regulator